MSNLSSSVGIVTPQHADFSTPLPRAEGVAAPTATPLQRTQRRQAEGAAGTGELVQALVQRVFVREEAAYTARYPKEQPVNVRITLKNGAVHEGNCTVTKGEPANPHTLYGIFGDAQWTNKDRLPDKLLRDLIEHFSALPLGNSAAEADAE